MSDCLFCRVVTGDIPSIQGFADDQLIAFDDIHPQAPTHLLIIPREHISSVNALTAAHTALVGHMVLTAQHLARERALSAGYRLVCNTGQAGGQTVDHLHIHLLGGRHMTWPPG